ncbi:MAG: hypothetical protein ACOYYI_09550 [Chloroflexota bacterium]
MKKKTSNGGAAGVRVNEQFDLNAATVAGTIVKLWGRNRDVFLRLRVSLRGDVQETEDVYACYVTIRIPDGTIGGKLVTLQPGIVVRVDGYITHANYEETLRRFLNVAGRDDFFDKHIPPEDLDAWRAIQFRRQNAVLNALKIEPLAAGKKSQGEIVNLADLEGIVAKKWEYPRGKAVDQFVRIAVYDEYTPARDDKKGNFGKPYRQPHYVNVLFPDGKTVEGIEVKVKTKQRIRVRGEFRDQGRRVTLRDALVSLGSSDVIDMMGRVINPEALDEISAQQESLHVLANAVIVYN